MVRRSTIDFNRPARLDDVLRVTAVIACVRKASVEFVQECWRRQVMQNSDDEEKFEQVASGRMLIACLDADSYKPTAIPENMQMVLGR